ncbi:MAG: hypothetical protein GEU79_17200 [Acidimicrobiia bacterium]|nr:hypothetical protein [Acidimicrobiia bacterium]
MGGTPWRLWPRESRQQVGEELFISDRTVARHLTNIYNKVGVTNRTEAARLRAPPRDRHLPLRAGAAPHLATTTTGDLDVVVNTTT